jgi:hypothetical protein
VTSVSKERSISKRHHRQIANALVDIINVYPFENVFLYPVLDTLLLLSQKPRIISFYAADSKPGVMPLYTTMKDPEIYPAFEQKVLSKKIPKYLKVRVPTTDVFVCIHSFDTSQGISAVEFTPVSREERKEVAAIFSILLEEPTGSGRALLRGIENRLLNFDGARRKVASAPEKQDVIRDTVTADLAELLDSVRRVIDEALLEYGKSPLLCQLGDRELDYQNIFCVVQNKISSKRRGCFEYTARVLLSNEQKERIERCCKEHNCEDLESPLGASARSIADSAFASGVIDFSSEGPGEGRDFSGDDRTTMDSRRHEVEQCVYSRITDPARIFYIPVHIGGVAWMAWFTLTTKGPNDEAAEAASWDHNFRLYRTLISRINERLRGGIKTVYLQLLGKRLASELEQKESAGLLDRINDKWDALAYVCPHKLVRLIPSNRNWANSLELPDGRFVQIELFDNPYHERQIEHDILDEQSVIDECRNVLMRRLEADRSFKAEAIAQRHTIFNRIPLTKLQNALAGDPQELSGTARVRVEDAKRITEILNVSLWIALGNKGHHPLHGRGVIGILRWLEAHAISTEKQPVLILPEGMEEIALADNELSAAFTVLWNLWHNASVGYSFSKETNFIVEVSKHNGSTDITFVNEGVMPDPFIKYLMGDGPYPLKREEPAGLQIACGKIQQLGWLVRDVCAEGGHTRVTISIPTRNRVEF